MRRDLRSKIGVVLAALALDMVAGDPPNQWHPVAWMGTLIAKLRAVMPIEGQLKPLIGGAGIAFGGGGLVWIFGRMLTYLPRPLRWLVEVALLKSTFSVSGLVRAADDVSSALNRGDLEKARHWVGWHLVSRETATLDESQVAAATIESLAENLSDGVIAPLIYYRLGGLPLALAYRYWNTCDAMLGYRDAEREWLGKVPARFDDVLNVLPARLTAAGIVAVGACERLASGGDSAEPLAIYRRDRRQTDSPNAGHPMSAMAGGLGVVLEKVEQYDLGRGLRLPVSADIGRAVRMIYWATGVCLGIVFGIPGKKSPSPQPSPEGEGAGSAHPTVRGSL